MGILYYYSIGGMIFLWLFVEITAAQARDEDISFREHWNKLLRDASPQVRQLGTNRMGVVLAVIGILWFPLLIIGILSIFTKTK